MRAGSGPSGEGLSRRDLLKRLGAGAAAAWSAPVLSTLNSPAFAGPAGERCVGKPTFRCGSVPPREARCGTRGQFNLCLCVVDATNTKHCVQDVVCSERRTCNPARGNRDCPTGTVCVTRFGGCCPDARCVPLCGRGSLPPPPASPGLQRMSGLPLPGGV